MTCQLCCQLRGDLETDTRRACLYHAERAGDRGVVVQDGGERGGERGGGVRRCWRVVARWRALVAERKACTLLDLLQALPDFFE
jgi:hypothetical protein